ncbi:2-phosphosulfolactate phosphatase [Streptomyces sp. NPDC051940]|uniref:2-phosphosulfolactate phosphatase n=1 Tax=Streptomyces sp. NPDC051940 TaxID=3155675 RepID=UPI00342B5C48
MGAYDWAGQVDHAVRFDWGPEGAGRLADGSGCLVVVDVLSFTTAVGVAVEAGTRVFPYPWRDTPPSSPLRSEQGVPPAAVFAERHGAALAVGRRQVTERAPWSLSPAALRRAPFVERLVLPSPNGSAISAAAGDAVVVAASLRNAAAVARWLLGAGYATPERPVSVVASGERWPDGSLRPALEDLLGAGAVITALRDGGAALLSPEAVAAAASYDGTPRVAEAVTACASGRELASGGFAEDVAVAVEVGASEVVPVLGDGVFAAVEQGC